MRASDDTPIETLPPRDCDTAVGRPCPYHTDIIITRVWRQQGLDEMLMVFRRRERWTTALIGGLLAALLAISTTAIWGGVEIAAELGQIRGTVTTRLEVVETTVASDRAQISRMESTVGDGQTTVLVTLGEMREQLRAIDARLQRVEDSQSDRRR